MQSHVTQITRVSENEAPVAWTISLLHHLHPYSKRLLMKLLPGYRVPVHGPSLRGSSAGDEIKRRSTEMDAGSSAFTTRGGTLSRVWNDLLQAIKSGIRLPGEDPPYVLPSTTRSLRIASILKLANSDCLTSFFVHVCQKESKKPSCCNLLIRIDSLHCNVSACCWYRIGSRNLGQVSKYTVPDEIYEDIQKPRRARALDYRCG